MKLILAVFSIGVTVMVLIFLDIPKFMRSNSKPRSPSDECWCTECEAHRSKFKRVG